MDYEQMTSPCGLACFDCIMYAASKDPDIKKAIADKWNMTEEKTSCEGCRAQKGQMKFLPEKTTCKVYACTTQKGIDFCNECDEFPCKHLQPYADKAGILPHNTKVYNLCLIKKLGLDKWATEEAAKIKRSYFEDEVDPFK